MEDNYQNLALQLDQLDDYLKQYLNDNHNVNILNDDITQSKRTIKLGDAGVDNATVILYFKNDGLTTVQFKTGKNHILGKTLADFLYETIDHNESLTVNFSLEGIDTEDMRELLDCFMLAMDDAGNAEFTISAHPINQNSTQYEIISNNYKDRLVITHHSTGNLQAQGRPLFCYRKLMNWYDIGSPS